MGWLSVTVHHTDKNPVACLQYSIVEYRDKLYAEIVARKKELRRRQKEREAAAGGARRPSRSHAQPQYGEEDYTNGNQQ